MTLEGIIKLIVEGIRKEAEVFKKNSPFIDSTKPKCKSYLIIAIVNECWKQ